MPFFKFFYVLRDRIKFFRQFINQMRGVIINNIIAVGLKAENLFLGQMIPPAPETKAAVW